MKILGKDFIRYENDNKKLHCEDGPALIQFTQDGNEYNEWWNNGQLVAVFDKGIFKKTNQNSFTTLEEMEVPKKWKGFEGTLSLSDVQLLSPKLEKEVIPTITDGYRADFVENLKTTRQINKNIDGVVFRHELDNGKLHNNDGPALTNSNSDYAEWWDKGRLVATVKDGELKRSVDGTFGGLKAVEVPKKWNGYESTLSLTDLEHCHFKPEMVKIADLNNQKNKIEVEVNPAPEIKSKISEIRSNFMNTGKQSTLTMKN